MSDHKIATEIAAWIVENCQHAMGKDVQAETELIESGLLDSLDYLNLVTFIEETYNTEVDGDSMIPDNFCTPLAVSGLVK